MKGNLTEKWIVCRICLKQPKQEQMQTIFNKNDDRDLTRKILECGGVPIKRFDHYPDKICSKCFKLLHIAYRFRVTCQRSHKHLSRFIAPAADEDAEAGQSSDGQPETISQDDSLDFEETEEVEFKYDTDPGEVAAEVVKLECSDEEIVEMYEPMEEQDEVFREYEEELQNSEATEVEEGEEVDAVEFLMEEDAQEVEEHDFSAYEDEDFEPQRKKSKSSTRASSSRIHGKRGRPPLIKGFVREVMRKRKTSPTRKEESGLSPGSKKRGPKPKKNKETAYICDVCGNIYPSQGRLTEHIKLHKGIKPHECEICGHAFAQTQQLSRHMNTHTGNRPYKCSYCPAAFADLSTRNKHHRIHTNERPYVCDVCGKAFTYTNTLKFHKMIHTGEKPHVCDICGKGFQQAYKLRNHKITHEKRLRNAAGRGSSINESSPIIQQQQQEPQQDYQEEVVTIDEHALQEPQEHHHLLLKQEADRLGATQILEI